VQLTSSVLESLTRLPALEREAILASLSESEAAQLQYDWSFFARPDQLLPAGNWLTWLLLAARGFGKTRAAAEAVRALVCGPTPLVGTEYGHIAIVAETAADALP
jgi:phage terminase large subunit-like protein